MDISKSISTIFRYMNLEINNRVGSLGLTGSQLSFIHCIYAHNEMSQSDICKSLFLDKSSVAKMLNRLEKEGLIKKKVNPKDSRSYLVSLTDIGIELAQKSENIQEEWFDSSFLNLTEFEKRSLAELLDKASDWINKS